MSTDKKIGVIVCDSQAKWGGPGGIAKRIQELIAMDDEQLEIFLAEEGEFPNEDEMIRLDGVYITGSKHSVNDESQEWIKKLESFIQQAYLLQKPKVYGTCFGHQAIAKALGGKVAPNPSKTFICHAETIFTTPTEDKSSFFNDIRKISEAIPFRMIQSHGECVIELPKEARSVASSASCQHEVVLYSENIIGVQSHVDFVPEDMLGVLLPSFLERKIINKEEHEAARKSLMLPNATSDVAKAVRDFLLS